jgi:L-amino acid N-acyltransferase YncA
MKLLKTITTFSLATGVWAMVAGIASAKPMPSQAVAKGLGNTKFASVPEIDAGSGLLAIAVVVAATLLTMELRRRRA